MRKTNNLIAILIFIVFFAAGVFTLPHYGINWDTINHLPRGQAYLNYFLTGKKDFSNLPAWSFYSQNPDSLFIDADIPTSEVPKRSLYESDATIFSWFMEHDGNGHPPASDILSALFNKIFFGKLRLINDIDAYRVYGIFLSASLVSVLFLWVSSQYSLFSGIIASVSLMLYPLFWSESHFNTEKDVPETVFWSLVLYLVWRGIVKKSPRSILISGIFFGLALGTKINIVFISLVIIPWLFIYIFFNTRRNKKAVTDGVKKHKKIILAAVVAPIIGVSIFVLMWPYLWPDPAGRIMGVFRFYKQIGITNHVNPAFVGPLSTNTYPISWIFFTTPIITLLLTFTGALAIFLSRKNKPRKMFEVLIVLWLVVPILRVSLPGANIYGGVRQIMEYVPALCIMAGIGFFYASSFISKYFSKTAKVILYFIVSGLYIYVFVGFVRIHPNENVYFNFLVGGLSGAREKNIPSWGNTFGAAYRQGVSFINKNAEENARVVLVNELLPNIPKIWFRRDISFFNTSRSGYLRQGEWAITLVYQGTEGRSYYDSYLERFVEPVYSVKVDGVSVLKVWHNTDKYLKVKAKEVLLPNTETVKDDEGLTFDLKEAQLLSRAEIFYDEDNCSALKRAEIQISKDREKWISMPGVLPQYWKISSLGSQPKDGKLIEPFAGEQARYIKILLAPLDTCLFNYYKANIFVFEGEKLE